MSAMSSANCLRGIGQLQLFVTVELCVHVNSRLWSIGFRSLFECDDRAWRSANHFFCHTSHKQTR